MFDSLDHFSNIEFSILVNNSSSTIPSIQLVLDKHKIAIKKIKSNQENENGSKLVQLICKYHKDVNINSVLTEISSLENVLELEEG